MSGIPQLEDAEDGDKGRSGVCQVWDGLRKKQTINDTYR